MVQAGRPSLHPTVAGHPLVRRTSCYFISRILNLEETVKNRADWCGAYLYLCLDILGKFSSFRAPLNLASEVVLGLA